MTWLSSIARNGAIDSLRRDFVGSAREREMEDDERRDDEEQHRRH